MKGGQWKKDKMEIKVIHLIMITIGILLVFNFIPMVITAEECVGQGCNSNMTIVIGNEAPTIPYVMEVSAVTLNGGTTVEVEVSFNATDNNGFDDLDATKANVTFSKAGETDRTASNCRAVQNTTLTSVINCTITMQFYDTDGADWAINASIRDDTGVYAENLTTFVTVNTLDYVSQDILAITWGAVTAGSDDNEADNTITLTNGGNQDYPYLNITGYDASGDVSGSLITAESFSVSNVTGQTLGQIYMVNDTTTDVTANLSLVNHGVSVTEEIFFYVDLDIGLPADTYRSDADWVIQVS